MNTTIQANKAQAKLTLFSSASCVLQHAPLQLPRNFLTKLFMGMFGQMKDMYKIQKQAKEIKKELSRLHIEAELEGIVVIINGEQEVIDVKIPEAMRTSPKLEKLLIEAFNKASKKAQSIAADKMKGVMDQMGLNFPGK